MLNFKKDTEKLELIHRQTTLPEPGLLSRRKFQGSRRLQGYPAGAARGFRCQRPWGPEPGLGPQDVRFRHNWVNINIGKDFLVAWAAAGISYRHHRTRSREAGTGVITEGDAGWPIGPLWSLGLGFVLSLHILPKFLLSCDMSAWMQHNLFVCIDRYTTTPLSPPTNFPFSLKLGCKKMHGYVFW